jgi:hypothetical protein
MPPFSFFRWRTAHHHVPELSPKSPRLARSRSPLPLSSQMPIDNTAFIDECTGASDTSDPASVDIDHEDDPTSPALAAVKLSLNVNFDILASVSTPRPQNPETVQNHSRVPTATPRQRASPPQTRPRQRRNRLTAGTRTASRLAVATSHVAHPRAPVFHPVFDFGALLAKQQLQQTAILAGTSSARRTHLLDLGDDVLLHIVHHVMSPVRVSSADRVVERSFRSALPLASVCTRLRRMFYASLHDLELWQSGTISGPALASLAANTGHDLKRLVLRNCTALTSDSLRAVASNCTALRTLDVSNVLIVDDAVIHSIFLHRGRTLRSLLARGCIQMTDESLHTMAKYGKAIDALDIAGLTAVTDDGMAAFLRVRGRNIVSMVCSACPALTDATFRAMGEHCRKLEVLCARALPAIRNEGIHELCAGVGDRLEVLDVLDCNAIMVNRFLDSVGLFCPRLAARFMDGQGRTLKQVVISSLPGFIFHVTGRDAYNGR